MIYLNEEDLQLEVFEIYLQESIDDSGITDKAELSTIALCKTFLMRYDVDEVFDASDPIRDEFLASIMAVITCYKILTRNKARKINTDLKDRYKWALEQLEKIQTGKVLLNLPPKLDEAGESTVPTLYGNNTNIDFYI